MRKLCFLSVMILTLALDAFAQVRTITGKILDESGQPVIGAAVIAKESGKGTVADIDGLFKIEVATSDKTLVFNSIGYTTVEVGIAGSVNDVLTVVLKETAINLDESVVVGYGEFSRRSITSSIAKLSGDELADKTVPLRRKP